MDNLFNTIAYLDPAPEKPLEELFKQLHVHHDYPKEMVSRILQFMKEEQESNTRHYPVELFEFLEHALQTRFVSYRLLAILGCALMIPQVQDLLFEHENEHTKSIMLSAIETSIHHYILALKIDGSHFTILDTKPNCITKEVIDKHECSPGYIVEYLRTIYNSC
jgi:hypothetical protein